MSDSSLLLTLAELVNINSVNSSYDGGPGEAELAAYVRMFFDHRGIETWEQEVFPGRNNVIARLPGRDSSRRIVLEAHMDTVSVKGMIIPPFEPRVADGRMYGRGSCDTKAGLATMMHALASLKAEGITPPCEVWLAAVVDEEYSYRGVVKLCEGISAVASIVAEPTELRAVIATKGVLRWRIVARGKAAHSSKPHLGVNAIHHMSRVVLALEEMHARLAEDAPHALLGTATGNVGVITGGTQVNFVPDQCAIEIDRRLLPGEKVEEVLARYETLLVELRQSHPGLDVFMEAPMLTDEALETPESEGVVQVASSVLSDLGLNASPCGVSFSCDASKLARAGVPTIVFGPGSIDRAHAAVEYVELDQVQLALEFLKRFLKSFV
ncbi:M20 family metallopeptidase [Verrucomicrobium sp. BvORR034]|uniref:M20 family metallopeptidase n=1 Tax=Verrucomicrobium sp. BvORR034 TaxID=1396418 RepID=UPI000678B60E|nr:M20 family metallopeptidase [Verrucomicrobium sp. BvORR034]